MFALNSVAEMGNRQLMEKSVMMETHCLVMAVLIVRLMIYILAQLQIQERTKLVLMIVEMES